VALSVEVGIAFPVDTAFFCASAERPLFARRDVPSCTCSLAAGEPWDEDSFWQAAVARGFSPVIQNLSLEAEHCCVSESVLCPQSLLQREKKVLLSRFALCTF